MEKPNVVKLTAFDSTNKPRWVTAMTLGDMFDQTAESCTGDAVVFPNERISYPELAKLSDQYSKALMGLGVQRYDKVGIHLAAGIDYFALLLAIFKAGAVAVPVNGRFKERELSHVVRTTGMKVLFTSSDCKEFIDYAAMLIRAFPTLFDSDSSSDGTDTSLKLTHIVCISGNVPNGFLTRDDFEGAAKHVSDIELLRRRAGVRIRDTAILLFTSGTTAQPKAAMLSHEAIYRKLIAFIELWGITSSDSIWTCSLLFHVGGIVYGLLPFAAGIKLCHPGYFDPEVSLRQLAEEKCTIALPGFELIWYGIISQPAFAKTDLSAIRLNVFAAVREQHKRMQELLPNSVHLMVFGATEAILALTTNLPTAPLEARISTCGYPMPGMEMRIVDPDSGALLRNGQRGEIQYRGPCLFDGYYNEPELTRQAIDTDGWFHSGDLGELDQDGRLFFRGRLKDMLKVGGENVAAIEIEDFLMGHPALQTVQVVAAPDRRYDEVPAAFIQLKEGAMVSEEELINFCLGRIATFKVPRYIRFVSEWPMSGTKIQKYVLREKIAEELQRTGITEAPKLQSTQANTRTR